MGKPMADYVKLPEFDEYKEWFRDFADLKREDGIVQVPWTAPCTTAACPPGP